MSCPQTLKTKKKNIFFKQISHEIMEDINRTDFIIINQFKKLHYFFTCKFERAQKSHTFFYL